MALVGSGPRCAGGGSRSVLSMRREGVADGLPTGTVTFLFTDIEGSTPLWDADPVAMRAALARHDQILREAIDRADGYVFSTGGDGFGAAFQGAANAMNAALVAQRSLASERWPEGVELRVRMGIHSGETEERDGDYFGPPVNRAARLMGAANGGQIVVSAVTAGLAEHTSGIDLVDLGESMLKGIVEPVHVYGVGGAGYEWIDAPLVSSQPSAGNLPRPQTEFVGDLADLQRRVANLAQARIVTLTGSGGVGKTRAAIEIGWLVVDEFVDGVWMSELGPIADPEAVISSIASTLSVIPQPGFTAIEAIVDWCFGRRMLLIVDNCEHVLEATMELVSAIVVGCPTVTVLATSREPLGIDGEQVVRIPSLPQQHARELFALRAQSADSTFVASAIDDEAIGPICERLDGIPLAIELAASRVRSLSPAELLERLDDRFRLLRGAGRGGLERHQTLRATVAWSYQLLSDAERLLFDRLSVFAGPFDLAAAEAVCAGDTGDVDIDELDVVDLLGELVDKSMVVAVRGDGGTRYRLLETLRQYGEEKLDDRIETTVLRDAHLEYYAALATTLRRQWTSPDQLAADARFDAEWQNLRSAHGWSVAVADVGRSVALIRGVSAHALSRLRTEVGEWSERARVEFVERGLCPSTILAESAFWAFLDGDQSRAIELAMLGLEQDDEPNGVAHCRTNLWYALASAGRVAESDALLPDLRNIVSSDVDLDVRSFAATAAFQAGLFKGSVSDGDFAQVAALAREIGSPTFLAEMARLRGLGEVLGSETPDLDGANQDFFDALDRIHAAGADASWVEVNIALVALLGGRPDARATVRRALANAYQIRNWAAIESDLEIAAGVLIRGTAHEEATTLYGHLELRPPQWGEAGVAFRTASLAELPELDHAAHLRATGAAMTRHEMVQYALDALT